MRKSGAESLQVAKTDTWQKYGVYRYSQIHLFNVHP